MLFKISSFHPMATGGVKPDRPTLIRASTHFNARRVAGAYLEVPSDLILIELTEYDDDKAPTDFVVVDELDYGPIRPKSTSDVLRAVSASAEQAA